jgi:acyl-CoA thioester hydrolase
VSAERPPPSLRSAFRRFTPITPRWNDIDIFGHVNNAEFYAYFDTAVLTLMTGLDVVDPRGGGIGTLVVESGARFHREVLFADRVEVGLFVEHLGRSSVRYRLGVFREDEDSAAVDGHFVHVFVDRETRRPVPIPDQIRQRLAELAGAPA